MEKVDYNQGIATMASAFICSIMLYMTGGDHGIGWFIVTLLLIW